MPHKTNDLGLRFSKPLLEWYAAHKRDLPWRQTQDPYLIWLSEVILQQTRVAQGLPYYEAFSTNYPTVQDLAGAPLDDVLKLWQGLGYYSRARNLHHTAQLVVDDLDGQFPSAYDALISLKGIGPYTAAAVSSFSAREARAVVDGNVTRVLSRIYGIQQAVDESSTKKQIQLLADANLSEKHPDLHNQAIMELGATICTPKNTACMLCPVQEFCRAFEKGLVAQIPLKKKKVKVKEVQMHFLVLVDQEGKILVEQRDDSGIWKGLFQFPLEKDPDSTDWEQQALSKLSEGKTEKIWIHGPVKHLLTHRKIMATFHLYSCEESRPTSQTMKRVSSTQFENLAIPRLIDRIWKDGLKKAIDAHK